MMRIATDTQTKARKWESHIGNVMGPITIDETRLPSGNQNVQSC